MKESKTTYAYLVEHMTEPSFQKIRQLACEFVQKLPSDLVDELHESLNRGIDILDSEPLLQMYFYSFGQMHFAKLHHAFDNMNEYIKHASKIDIIDYGCGQGLATLCYHDYIIQNNQRQVVRSITLIEPSQQALSRAELLCSKFFPDAKISAINKMFNELSIEEIQTFGDIPTLHLFSNIIDVESYDLTLFSNKIRNASVGDNEYVIVSPLQNATRMQRLKLFAKVLEANCYYEKYLDKQELQPDKDWTCATILCSTRSEIYAKLDIETILNKVKALSDDITVQQDKDYCKGIFSEVKLGADFGNHECMNYMGNFYYSGIAIEKDYAKAMFWYKQSLEQGNISAACNLAYMYAEGRGVEKNISLAIEILNQFMNLNYAPVICTLGLIYKLKNDCKSAFHLFQEAAKLGDANAEFMYAQYLLSGEYCEKDIKKGIKFMKSSANHGNARANYFMAAQYEHGYDEVGIEMSNKKALKCYLIAAKKGYKKSIKKLGNIYGKGLLDINKNLKESFKWYLILAEKGSKIGAFNVAYYYANGLGTKKNNTEAVRWYTIAAEKGSSAAMNNLAICYENGNGIGKNKEKALELYQEAAKAGNLVAANNLSLCYENGNGVPKNPEKAFLWKEKVAYGGNNKAQITLSKWCLKGYGTSRSREQALFWFIKSKIENIDNEIVQNIHHAFDCLQKKANEEDPLFQYILAKCYDYGVYVDQDRILADLWYIKSANNGFIESKIKLRQTESLSTLVTQEDLSNSQKDEYGVVYSSDWKKVLSCSYCSCKNYHIRNGTRIIANGAFANQRIKKIVIPSSVVKIGDNPFSMADSNHENEFGIDNYSSNYVVDNNALYTKDRKTLISCWSDKVIIDIAHNVKHIGSNAFKSNNTLQHVHFPQDLESIGRGAFFECFNLKSLDLPSSLRSIGTEAFYGCEQLECVWSLGTITILEDSTFYGCNLKQVHLPTTLEIIKDNVFNSNKELETIDLPDSVSEIGNCAFAYCYDLKRINLGGNVIRIGDFCFWKCNIKEVHLPSSLMSLGNRPFCDIDIITINDGSVYKNIDNMIIDSRNRNLVMFIGNNQIVHLNEIESISPLAFYESNVHEVFIQGNITVINEFAFFQSTNLSTIHFSQKLKDIRCGAFAKCGKLRTIRIPANVSNIENGVFQGCYSLESIFFEGNNTKVSEDIIVNKEYDNLPIEYESSLDVMGVMCSDMQLKAFANQSLDSLKTIKLYVPKNSSNNYIFKPVFRSLTPDSIGRKFEIIECDEKY